MPIVTKIPLTYCIKGYLNLPSKSPTNKIDNILLDLNNA